MPTERPVEIPVTRHAEPETDRPQVEPVTERLSAHSGTSVHAGVPVSAGSPMPPGAPAPAGVPASGEQPAGPVEVPPTELRVHGVSGTPAEDMLDRPLISRVAGDGEAGFFRPRPEYGATLGPGGARLEAYRWGNLTAGAAARAFWLLLLPFTLANVPMWLRPPAVGMGRRIVNGLCRIFALTISATFTLAAVGVFLDLVAWQCGAPGSPCVERRPWLEWLFTGFFEPTGRRLALAMLGPVLVVGVLWFLAIRSWARYESFQLPEHNVDGDGLATPSFWDGRAQVGRLRSLHIAAMFATIDAVVLYVLQRHDRGDAAAYEGVWLGGLASSDVLRIGQILFLASLAAIGVVVLLLMLPPMVDRVSKSRVASLTAKGMRWVGLLLTAATMAYALLPRDTWTTEGPLPGYAGTVTKLFAAQTGLLALLTLVVLVQRRRAKGALFGGFGAPVIASLGLGLSAAFSAGVSYRVADYLNGDAVPSPAEFGGEPGQRLLQPPVQYEWAAIGFVLMVLVALLAALWVRFVTRPLLARAARDDTDDDYPGGRERDAGRAATIDKAIANARLTDAVTRTFGLAWFIVAGAGVVATAFALADIGPVQLAPSGSLAAEILSVASNAGTYLISLSVLLLVFVGIQTYRNARVRRTVGVIWDLATFWPRAAHPLAPPCYAERVVPELVHRANWLATQQGGLVLSGHSQGSVLAAATVLQLPAAAKQRTALLTYGSPLARLYQRAFPNYFGTKVMGDIAASVASANGQARWVNLWRATDPIGGPIGGPLTAGDRRLADPVAFDPLPGERLAPAVAAHSGYQVTPQFAQALEDLLGLLPTVVAPPAPATTPTHVTMSTHGNVPATEPPVDPALYEHTDHA
jgi:hypothetical protein